MSKVIWRNRLDEPQGDAPSRAYEGGLRTKGQLKTGRASAPLISYVTVVLNGEKSIDKTLDSVARQRYENIEHIVIDGGSQDRTLEMLVAREAHIDYLVSEPDAGLYDALNKAIGLCRGDLICVLNSDDWLLDDAAQTAAQAHLQARRAAHLILTAAEVIYRGARHIWQPGRLNMGGYFECANICHNGVYASRQAYELAGLYDSSYRIAGDFKWLMSCLEAGCESISLPQVTIHYTLGGLSSDTTAHSKECVRLILERFPFLSSDEAWGLFHAFHVFEDNKRPFKDLAPSNYTEFIGQLALRYQLDAGFIHALGLAALPHVRHSHEFAGGRIKPTRMQKWKNSIRKRLPHLVK